MKKGKKILSIMLCITLMLSVAPMLDLGLFKTEAGAVSYAKKHDREYYYDSQTKFVEYIAVGCDKKGDDATNALTKGGYTKIDMDLNKDAGGYYIFLGYKSSSTPSNPIKDIRILDVNDSEKNSDNFVATNGFTYTIAGRMPTSQNNDDGSGIVDLNRKAGGATLNYYATKDEEVGDPIIDVAVTFGQDKLDGYESVKYLNSADFVNIADANKGSGGAYIYTHVKRLPQVDTTALRSAMETATDAIASKTFVESSKTKLNEAMAVAKNIINEYDNYSGSDSNSYSNKYSQTDIDNAKKALEDSYAYLKETIDTSNTPKVKFYVPETIYLNPDNGTTFQYMSGVDSNGKAIQPSQSSASSAKIYFDGINCSPSSVKITCEAATTDNASSWTSVSTSAISSITFGGKSFNGTTANSTGMESTSFPLDTTCSGGTLSSAVSSGNTRFIRWRADYVLDGVTYTIYSYSVCYRQPIYTADFRHSSRAYTGNFNSSAMINAKLTVSGITGESISKEQGSTDLNSKGSDNNNGTASITIPFTIDSSRFLNYNCIPYFGAKYEILNSRQNGKATVTAYNSNATATTKEIGTEQTAIDLPITSSELVVCMHASAEYRDETAQNYTYINISPVFVNKASLRTTYNNVVSEMRQQKMFNTGFDAYQNSILETATKLGTPTNTDTTAKIIIAGMERKTGSVTTTYINETTGSTFSGVTSETKSFTCGEDVKITYKDIPGYSLSSYKIYSGSTELTSGTPLADSDQYYIRNADGNLRWEFHYSPITYTVSYNGNGATRGSTASSTHTYDVEKALTSNGYNREFTVTFDYNYSGATATTATATSVFNGWICSKDGKTYANGASVINLTTVDKDTITMTAQWTDVTVDFPTPTRTGYTFKGWATADGKAVNKDTVISENITLYAQWDVINYTVTFKNGDQILQSGEWAYGSTPSYSGDTPTKAPDQSFEYKFSGWSPEVTSVTGDTTYTAQFEEVEHSFKSVELDGDYHRLECTCGIHLDSAKHNVEKKDGEYVCKDCGYVVPNFVISTTAEGVTITKDVRANLTTKYYVATVTYNNATKPNKDGKYFVYWYDTVSGEIVSAYTTYNFFLTQEVNIIPVFASQKDYYTERAKATAVLRMMNGCIKNNDGTYSILAEHSVSSSEGKINKHGIIYTTDSSQTGNLTMDNNDTAGVEVATARKTQAVRTGMFEVKISGSESGVVYARPYAVIENANGEITYKYGEMKTYDLSKATSYDESEIISTSSYDLGDISAEEPIEPVAPTVPTDSVEDNTFGQLTTFFARLIEIIKTVLSFFGITGVAK